MIRTPTARGNANILRRLLDGLGKTFLRSTLVTDDKGYGLEDIISYVSEECLILMIMPEPLVQCHSFAA